MRLRCIPSLALVAIIGQSWIAHVCTGPVPTDFILMADEGGTIYRLDLPSNNYMALSALAGIPFGVAYDSLDQKVYWTDTERKQIRVVGIDGTNEAVFKQLDSASKPEGIAVDSDSGLIFYTDPDLDVIVKLTKDGSSETIIDTGVINPRGIVLDPRKKKMYWTDWGTNKIETANYDETERNTLIDTGLIYPNSITLNNAGDEMYWADASTRKIEGANIDGSNRHTIFEDTNFFFMGLTFYKNDLYFTDLVQKQQLHAVPVLGGTSFPIGPKEFSSLKMVYYHDGSLLPQG